MQQLKPMLALFALSCGASAAPILIGFDELPTQSADGVNISGVTFGFSLGGNPSAGATYNAELPVATTYLNDRVLLGPLAGVLTLQFAAPTPTLQFGFVLNTLDPQQPGAFVELFDASLQSLGSMPVDSDTLMMFSEGQFTYSGIAVSRAQISFNTNAAADTFAIDNLQFEGDPTGTPPVPEPGALLLVGSVIAGLGISRRYHNPRM